MNFVSSFRLTLVASLFAFASSACGSSEPVLAADEKQPDGGGAASPDGGSTANADSSGEPEFPRFYAGEVEGTDARVGIIGKDYKTWRLYFCGGPLTIGSLTHWFNAEGLASTEDGYTWTGQIEHERAEGAIHVPGEGEHAFEATPVKWGGLPGLYEATAPCGKVGVIISPVPDSDDVHVQGACTGAVIADSKQVNPILPVTRAADGSIEVTVEGEADVVVVKPAAL